MTGRLAGLRIMVTGAASGMGEAIARLFAQEKAKLALLDMNADKLAEVSTATGQLAIETDVSKEDSVKRAVDRAVDVLGGLDGLVNAAGILVQKSVSETDWATFQRIIGVNLGGPFLTCRAALPHLQASGRGAIVNVSSLAGLRTQKTMGVYSASKAGLLALTEALAGEAGPSVRVNAICPGIIRTPMTAFMWQNEQQANDLLRDRVQMARARQPSEVAEAALWLCSPAASFVSAATLTVTGGHIR